jgi:signal transduction histidine kinase
MSTVEQVPSSRKLPGSRLEFETLIADTSAALLAAPPERLDQVVERGLERVREFFEADRCALLSVSADRQVVNVRLASYAAGLQPVPTEANLAEAFPWTRQKLLDERVPIRVARIADLPPEADVERAMWIEMSIRSALTLPIETDGVVRHIILLNSVHREREWPEVLVTRLRVLGEILASALDRREALSRLQTSMARLDAGGDLAGLAHYEADFVRKVMYLDDRLRDLCGIPPDAETGLGPLAFWLDHIHPEDRQQVLNVRRRMQTGGLDRVSIEYRYLHPTRGELWIDHLAGVAARDTTGRAIRTFGVCREITNRKQAETELRDLSQRLIGAHEEERALLARELHDDVTQRLAVLAIEVGRVEVTEVDEARAVMLGAVRLGLTRLSEDIHAIAHHLHPSVLKELGLAEALRAECERWDRQGQLEVSVDIEELPDAIGENEALCLFRVAQEALNNVARHAKVPAAWITLRPLDGGLLLAVRDRGAGFAPSAPGRGRHLGLASMRERIQLAKGTLDIESAPGEGTTIVAWVPLGNGA